jgi:hypothetical protein
MRLWSLHPSMLDRLGLTALWREGLLAQKVLMGQTKGYRFHPQLQRFQANKDPVAAIGAYLWAVADEAGARGYHFDASKIARGRRAVSIPVTQGQLEYERAHLRRKLKDRDRAAYRKLSAGKLEPHPILRVVAGGIEGWEVVRGLNRRAIGLRAETGGRTVRPNSPRRGLPAEALPRHDQETDPDAA